ncbi:Por secretion system C-terminal sorting domain-containing protein [Dyadobacter sp. SG02]|nr:Por secretion system C-terminal sorting domain-containing protein [Dyadobacter sp. SG02]
MFLALFAVVCFGAQGQNQTSISANATIPATNAVTDKFQSAQVRAFAENKGQIVDIGGKANKNVRYLLNMPGLNVQLRQTGFSYDAYKVQSAGGNASRKYHRVDIELEGANPAAKIVAAKPAGGTQNMINERGDFLGIRQFEQVTYHDIYPGIDLEFVAGQGNGKPVEYNFVVYPGADASAIRMRYKGADKMALSNGKIVMNLRHGKLSEQIPASWLTQTKKSVNVSYKALDGDLYAFHVPAYDKSKTLVIDPTPNVEWATYYGGTGEEQIRSVATDPDGNIYVTGTTTSNSNIATAGTSQTAPGGDIDIFVAKFNSNGVRQWGTYYGGAGKDEGNSITYSNGQVYIAGETISAGMATAGAFQDSPGPNGVSVNSIIARFNVATGNRNWATYYGGGMTSFASRISVDANGNIFVLGGTAVNLFPLSSCAPGNIATAGTYRQGNGCTNSWLAKFNSAGARLWGTFVAGSDLKAIASRSSYALDVDAAGNVYVGGSTALSATYDASLAFGVGEGTAITTDRGYLMKFNANGGRVWGRFYDGTFTDLKVDEANNRIQTVGYTTSATGIASSGAYKTTKVPATDGFWVTFDMSGHYQKGTYLGGQGLTYGMGVKVDNTGDVIVAGHSTAAGNELSTNCSFQTSPAGNVDAFINKFSASSGQRIWGTYYGGPGFDYTGYVSPGGTFGMDPAFSSPLAITEGNKPVLAGYSGAGSPNLATEGSHQRVHGGATDGWIAKFNTGELPAGFAVASSSLSPMSQNACILGIPGIITGNAVGATAPANYSRKLFYQWQSSSSASGPWTDLAGEVFKDLQPLASQTTTYYRRLVRVNTDYCNQITVDSSQAAAVQINANASPIANADGPQWYVCGAGSNTVALNGAATGGTPSYSYQWYEGSTSNGTPLATTGAWTTPAITRATTYTLQVTDAAGCVDIDQVTVVPAVANAGADKSICQGAGGVQIGTEPVASPSVQYSWSVVSGGALSTLSCTTCAQPIANPAVATTYRLTVTVTRKGGTTCTSFDDVTVTPITAPGNTLAFAGADRTVCKNTTITIGGTADNTYAYTWTPGQYLSASQVANPVYSSGTALVTGGYTNYTVSAVKAGCTFTDEVKVYSINNRITDQDELNCGPMWSTHLDEENAPGAVYSWSVVSGNGVILQTAKEGRNAYLKSNSGVTKFRRTVTLNGVSCIAELDVEPCTVGPACDFDIVTLSDQACPKVFGPLAALKLGTTLPASDYNFSWSPANLVDNAHAAIVNITSTAPATITVTVTNKYDASITCQESIVINPPGWSLPAFVAPDKYTCPGTSIQIGGTPVSGFTYAWTPDQALSAINIANPVANVTATQAFYVTIKETASGCVNKDTVNVVVPPAPVANTGNDRAVCNGSTVTLGSPAPAGTNWVYSWEPSNTAWTNGTGPSDAQPQVQFAFSTPQSYILTVTDPLTGCMDKDTVVLRNTVTTGEYAGNALATCQGVAAQLGREAEPFAQYEWFMADGVTPATGLSCITCANPIVTNPALTTTYTVKVSYPGCNTPMTDQVTLTVNPVQGLELIDKNVCPAGPIAIGYGSAGNPAAPAGATYQWVPATGLSSATVANPTANVTQERIYSVTVTLPSGCTFTDEVKVTPSANAGSDAVLCPGESTTVGTPAIAGATYSWTGAGIVGAANVAQPTVKPTTTTTYSVSVTLNGCTTTDQVVVTVNSPADFAITGNTAICEGGVATLSLAGAAPANTTWQWSPLAGVASPNATSTTVAAASTQTYRLTQTNLNTGCSNYKEVVVVVNPNTIAATVDNVALCQGTSAALPLNVTSSGNYSYVWAPSVGLSNAFVANPTVSTGSPRTYTVTVTDNTSQCQLVKQVNVAINAPEACFAPVTLTGNVFHDANALKDVTVNSTATDPSIPTGLYVTLVDNTGAAVKTVAVNADGTYDFGVTNPGDYSIVLHQTSTGSTVPSLPAGWVNTGENLGAGVGSDAAVNGILTGVTVAGTNVTNANFGVQQPPVTTGGTEPTQPNPGGTTTVDLTSHFGLTDPDGTVTSITFTEFPADVTTITINGTTYVAPGTTPGAGQQVWPAGNLTVPATGLSVLVDPVDGGAEVEIPFFVTDNGGLESNVSVVTADFTIPTVSLSGNVFHDANALTDNTVNTTGSVTTIPTGLFVTLVDNAGNPVATVPVNADGSYDFGDVEPGTYSVVLHQTATGSTVPSLPTGWNNTGEHLGANAGSDGTVNGILPNITVTTTDVIDANFGVQQPPVTTDENLPSSPNPGGTVTVDISDDFNFTDPDGTVETITFTEFPENVTTVTINGTTYVAPGETPGPGEQVFPVAGVTVPVTGLEVLIDPIDGNPTVDVPFKVTDNGGLESNESSVTKPFTTPVVSLSGNVFHDANALTDNTVNTTSAIAIPSGLYVTLVDNAGNPVATVAVQPDGSYDFGNVEPGTYSVVLHQTAAGSTTPSLPTGWNNTGEHLGANAGSDGTVNGILPNITVTTTDVTNANFGVQQPPVADPKDYLIDQPVTDAILPLNGSHVSTGVGTTSPDQLTGADPEDGTLNGDDKDRTVVITTLPNNGELYYNGVLVTPGQVIPNYNPDSLAIKLTGTGYTSTTFEYAYVDEAGVQSPPAPYTIRWEKPLPVTLVSFTATARENTAELNWATSEETNSDRFEIQRSIDGKAWKEVGSVKAEGESKVRKTYSFVDRQPEIGDNLFRLKMVDADGTFAFSAIRSVRFESKLESSIYPNPVSNELALKVTSWKQVKAIRIDNLAGLQVYSSGPVDSGKVDVSKLDAGVYILRITHTDGSVHTHKFVHIK